MADEKKTVPPAKDTAPVADDDLKKVSGGVLRIVSDDYRPSVPTSDHALGYCTYCQKEQHVMHDENRNLICAVCRKPVENFYYKEDGCGSL